VATGVSESRLRTWERRYGVPLPARAESGRRWYEDADLAVVRRMAALVEAGIPASEAARAALTERAIAQPEPVAPVAPAVEALVAAAGALDARAVAMSIEGAAAEAGWGAAFDALIAPGLQRMHDDWARGRSTAAGARLTAELARAALGRALMNVPEPRAPAPLVLLAAPDGERDGLVLAALWLLLRERGLRVVPLGRGVPARELADAAAALQPAAVCLVANDEAAAGTLAVTARELVERRVAPQLFLGGGAVARGAVVDSAPGVRLPRAVMAMADGVARALGARAVRSRARSRRST
jgi:methylmalonyl-CoA mutase cobalamin-binding subunit